MLTTKEIDIKTDKLKSKTIDEQFSTKFSYIKKFYLFKTETSLYDFGETDDQTASEVDDYLI